MSEAPEDEQSLYFRSWTATARLAARYFSYEVEGFEHLEGASGLLVGYHPGPFPWDQFMLWTRMYDRLGRPPRMISHHLYHQVPVVRSLARAIGFLDGAPSPATIAALRARRQHLFVAPGGTREGLRPFWRRARVDWGGRTGFLKLAAQNGLPLIPVASASSELAYLGLVDGYRLSLRLFGHGNMPVWTGLGLGGLWPFALPWPVTIRQKIGAPIDLAPLAAAAPDEAAFLDEAYRVVTSAVQTLLDELRATGARSPAPSSPARARTPSSA
jgi:1-acyl-sn-glycerol-3-phosphate acyltransferase